MDAVDKNVPLPVRDIDKPFAMPIEDIFSISGRGTVVTGRVEPRQGKVGEEIEIVGFRPTQKKSCDGRGDVPQIADEGLAGDNVGLLLRGTEKEDVELRAGSLQAGVDHTAHDVQGGAYVLTKEEGGRHTPFFHGLPAAVLFSHHGRDGDVKLPTGVEMVMPGDNVSCEYR